MTYKDEDGRPTSQRVYEVLEAAQRTEAELLRVQQALLEKSRTLEAVNRIGLLVASETDVDAILQVVTDAARELAGAQFGAFFYNTNNEHGERFMLYTLSGADAEDFRHLSLPRATPLLAPTYHGTAVVRADDVTQHELYGQSGPHFGMPAGHLPVRSYLAVPVVSRSGDVFGGLFLGHAEPALFTENHESAVRLLAAQAAVGIEHARLLEEARSARRQLEQLNRTLEDRAAGRTAAVSATEQQFRQLVDGIKDCAVYMLDPHGQVATWNPGAERIKGYSAAEVLGQHFRMFYTPEDRARGVPEQALGIARTMGKYESENWRVRKDGTRFWASVLIDAILADDGELVGFAKVTRDMTERRAIEEQLHQAQKMEAIGQLTGGVAHDFNNLLTIILGNLQTLARRLPAEETHLRRAVDHATRGAQRAAMLTNQLLSFARRQPLNPKPADVNRLIGGMSELLRRVLGENVAIETVLAAGLWRVEIDPHQLESALLNLAVNSRDAMPDGGKLTLETWNAHIDEGYAAGYLDVAPGQYVALCVSDTGVGMTKEIMARAIDPFFTTKPIGQGTGLGLSQVFGFVKQSGGHLKLYSEVGEGTTAKLYFPRYTGPDLPEEPAATVVDPRARPDETILVVEDEDDVRRYSTESLRELGYTVLEAPDGPSALRVLDEHADVHLLFTDVGLPGMNGGQLAREARLRRPDLRVLYTTGYARNAIVHQGRLDPGVELLVKPFTRAQLATRVRDVLDVSPDVTPRQARALIVEDEPLVRLFLVEVLAEAGFDLLEAATVRDGLGIAERCDDLDVAFIDLGLPDGDGSELAARLRTLRPAIRIVVASGHGEDTLSSLRGDARVTYLAKPYDEHSVIAALEALGLAPN